VVRADNQSPCLSSQEQTGIEQHFIKQGYLLPKYHRAYWLGLRATQWPSFAWIDKTAATTNYRNWGQHSDGSFEPKDKLRTCGAGNFSMVRQSAWGWAGESCNTALPFMCRLIKPGNITITSNITGNVFTFMTVNVTQARGQALCNDIGGHLASYVSQDEQTEMEFAFVNSGYLLPSYHKNYWIGLTTTADTWPQFDWLDRNVPSPSQGYAHWGTFSFGGFSTPEPNNGNFPENCAVANWTESYGSAWGWADANCAIMASVVCRRLRECLASLSFCLVASC
jgi:hypothetical protein